MMEAVKSRVTSETYWWNTVNAVAAFAEAHYGLLGVTAPQHIALIILGNVLLREWRHHRAEKTNREGQ